MANGFEILGPAVRGGAVAVRTNRVAIGAQEHTVSVGLQGGQNIHLFVTTLGLEIPGFALA